ncbi:NADPH-flavin oxidoreductase [subsurface metagenome]
MEVLEAIRTRRSVRQYKATPIDDKTLELILEAARWAPSWSNTQCWRFIVVRDDKVKKELATTIPKANRARDCVENAPVTIVACAEIGKAGYLHGKFIPDKNEWWYMFDIALAMQNLVLAAHSLGLGTVYTGWFDPQKAASILGVPPGFSVVAMTPLGYPDLKPKTTPRRELSQTVFYDKFKS